jgi:hypothetical protein
MDRQAVKDVLRDVFGANILMKDIGKWVSIRCPLAPWTHEHGHDSSPSAGVSVDENGTSVFSCFTCKNPGPLHTMLRKYADFTGEDLTEIIEELSEEAYFGPRTLPDWDRSKENNILELQMPLDEGIFMDLYDDAAGHPYLLRRGISRATATKMELKFDPADSEGDARILFPCRGPDGLLYGFSGRAIRDDARLKVRDYHGFKKAHNILGANLIAQDKPDHIVIVEGLMDVASTYECGHYGAGVLHSTMTQMQADIIRGFGIPTYLMYDNPKIDKAGGEGVEIAGKLLYRYVPTMRVRYPDIEIEDDSEEGFHMCKDPGDLLPEEMDEMIADARPFRP